MHYRVDDHGLMVDTDTSVQSWDDHCGGRGVKEGVPQWQRLHRSPEDAYWLEVGSEEDEAPVAIAMGLEPVEAMRWLENERHALPPDLAALDREIQRAIEQRRV